MKYLFSLLFFLFFYCLNGSAQEGGKSLAEQADEAYALEDYGKATQLYEAQIDSEPNYWNIDEWQKALARCYVQLNDFDRAKELVLKLYGENDLSYSDFMLDPVFKPLQDVIDVSQMRVDTITYYYDIVMDLVNSKDSVIRYDNKTIKLDLRNTKLLQYYGEFIEDEDSTHYWGRKKYYTLFDKSIEFNDCKMRHFAIENIGLLNLTIRNVVLTADSPTIYINELYVNRLKIFEYDKNENSEFYFHNSTIKSLYINGGFDKVDQFLIRDNVFGEENTTEDKRTIVTDSLYNLGNGIVFIGASKSQNFEFYNNTVNSTNTLDITTIGIKSEDVQITNNTINTGLDLNNLSVSNHFEFAGNNLGSYVSIYNTLLSELHNEISWHQINGQKLVVLEDIAADDKGNTNGIGCDGCHGYFGLTQKELKNEPSYKRLISSYYKLYRIYKDAGDIESANGCYAEMKEVTGRRLKAIYNKDGGFKNYIEWKLNRLLKVYTNHGTDAALPIAISIYVILLFSVFYFFYPSEWDVSSKSKLLHDFKEFKTRNNKGYFRPLLVLLAGLFVSLFNAFTLSINAFVTLGFGSIPTKGLARYVCVLQGFIGWFLLSIFTVTLINQVLF